MRDDTHRRFPPPELLRALRRLTIVAAISMTIVFAGLAVLAGRDADQGVQRLRLATSGASAAEVQAFSDVANAQERRRRRIADAALAPFACIGVYLGLRWSIARKDP